MLDEKVVEDAIGRPLYLSKNIPVCITSSSLKFEYVNDIFCEIAGYSRDELLGKSIAKLIGPKQLIDAFKEFYFFSLHGKNEKKIWRVKNKKGKTIVSKIEVVSIVIEGNKYNLTFAIDYTEFDKNKELVQATEEKYKLLAETMPHFVWTNDGTGKPIYMNKVAKKYFGKTEEEFDDWDWLDHFDIEEAREFEREWEMASQMKNPVQRVSRIKNYDGEFKWFQIVLYPQLNEFDETVSWTAIATDIDDRIKAEQKLSTANKRLRSLIDASPIPIYSIDDSGIIKDFWNPAAEKIMGWKREEVIGKFLPHVREEHIEEFNEVMDITRDQGWLSRVVKRKDKDDNDIIIDINSGCVYDDHGNIEEIMVTLLDITELEQKKIHLEESLNEKKTLLQEIHHRVKNNLAIVVSLLQLQVYQTKSEKEKNKLLDAQNRVMSIAMVHELLYSTEEFSKVDLRTYYDQLIETIKANMFTGTKGVKHELDIGLESLNITQAIPLGLLVNELVTNSLKYAFPKESEENSIRLSIHADGNQIKVDFIDNGVGFDMSEDSFKTGLGFKIMDSLLSQLDSTYQMVSTDGFNLSFTFQNILEVEEQTELI
ncbi:MAG: PAS domain-containing sensor histidine kinase [Balneolaceae bacterium]